MTFDRRVLSLLPPMDTALEGRVLTVLRAIAERRVLPFFSAREDVTAVQLARASERYRIARFEDVSGEIELVSFVATDGKTWTVHIHERVFDYIAFGLPANPLQAFQPTTEEAAKVMALAEFVLRHEFDHIVRSERTEVDVLASDCGFVVERRESEPGFFDHLMQVFLDPTNGLRTEIYSELIARFEENVGFDTAASDAAASHLDRLGHLPPEFLGSAFMTLAPTDKERLVAACYQLVSDRSLTVAQRARHLESVLALFARQLRDDETGLRPLFDAFLAGHRRDHALRDLEIMTEDLDPGDADAVYQAFVQRVAGRPPQAATPEAPPVTRLAPALEGPHLSGEWPKPDSLRQRIEAARLDPRVPPSVKRAIDNNATNIESHSSAKYTEFIETLLSIPWGTIQPIDVGPREFSAGLDAGHFGLAAPKELVADFFANLIWRYRDFDEAAAGEWKQSGSAFLFVGPPGVGKTSLAISIARNLGLPYHKISLGGLRDESALRGHGFTYEGSKPGAIVQGLIKMGTTNGVFILDEADKSEPMTVATLLEILDPEQNHLFHDKYTLSTVDIDLSNCHFILTANTLDTVPAPVIDRCQVVHLDRYSIEEKVEIARRFILPRLRNRHRIEANSIDFEAGREDEHLRYLIRSYTHEAGVRQLELALRTLLLRLQRRHIFEAGEERVEITHGLIKRTLETPAPPATVNDDDRIGEMLALGVNPELGIGSVIPVQATRIGSGSGSEHSAVSMVHATGNLEKVMDESRRVATTAILYCAGTLGFDPETVDVPVHLHFLGGSTRKDGPSAGAAIALALASLLSGSPLRRDVAATGEIDTQGRITGVGGIDAKIETAINAGCKTVVIPAANLTGPGGIDRLPDPVRRELQILTFEQWRTPHEAFDPEHHRLQVVAVEHILEAFEVARVDELELDAVERLCTEHARGVQPMLTRDQPCPVAVLVKNAEEIDEVSFLPALCEGCAGCHLLVPAGSTGRPSFQLPALNPPPLTREIQPGAQGLGAALRETAAALPPGDDPMVVVAPFFALQELGDESLSSARPVVFIANNYLAQGYKIKGVKASLNRTVCRLLHVGRPALDSFPLLGRKGGVFVPDLGAVPEKYRLDPGRCEELLQRFLDAWLDVVDSTVAAEASGSLEVAPPRDGGAEAPPQ